MGSGRLVRNKTDRSLVLAASLHRANEPHPSKAEGERWQRASTDGLQREKPTAAGAAGEGTAAMAPAGAAVRAAGVVVAAGSAAAASVAATARAASRGEGAVRQKSAAGLPSGAGEQKRAAEVSSGVV